MSDNYSSVERYEYEYASPSGPAPLPYGTVYMNTQVFNLQGHSDASNTLYYLSEVFLPRLGEFRASMHDFSLNEPSIIRKSDGSFGLKSCIGVQCVRGVTS